MDGEDMEVMIFPVVLMLVVVFSLLYACALPFALSVRGIIEIGRLILKGLRRWIG